MNIDWDLYKYFYYVCEFGSITKVANYFYISQPAVTKKINKLEDLIQKNLIIRTNKGIKITNEGKVLFDYIKPIVEGFSKIETEFMVSDENKITIKIVAGYATVTKILTPLVYSFNKKYPNIKVWFETCSFEEGLVKLKAGEVDILLFSAHKDINFDENIIVKDCYKLQEGFIISNKIKNEFPDKISIKDLDKYDLIMKDSNSKTRRNFEEFLKNNNIKKLNPKYELTSYGMVENYIKANKGMGFYVLDYVKDDIENGIYKVIETYEKIPKRQMCCGYLKNSKKKSSILKLVSWISNVYDK